MNGRIVSKFEKYNCNSLLFPLIIIYPTTVVEAHPIIGSDTEITIEGKNFPTFPTYIQNTNPGSYAGLPSISLPLVKTSKGLPVGIHLETMPNQDKQLFAIAELIQNELQ